MKGRYLFVALVVTTGCSAILGFDDGKLSPGLSGDPCDLYNSPATACAAGYGCFANTCYQDCPSNGGACPSGTRCLPADEPGGGGGGTGTGGPTSVHSACVPLDKAKCTGGSGSTSAPVCTNGGMEQCIEGECRASCQVQQPGNNGPVAPCRAGEVCVAQNPNGGQGFCYATTEAPDGSTPTGTADGGAVLSSNTVVQFTAGNVEPSFARAGDYLVWVADQKIQGCSASAGCAQPLTILQGVGSAPTNQARLASIGNALIWTAPDGVHYCDPSNNCMPQNVIAATNNWAVGAQSPDVFWLEPSGGTDLTMKTRMLFNSGAQPSMMGTVMPGASVSPTAIAPVGGFQAFVLAGGRLSSVVNQTVLTDNNHQDASGRALLAVGTGSVVWFVASGGTQQLLRCTISTGGGPLCDMASSVSTFRNTGPVTALTMAAQGSPYVYWSEDAVSVAQIQRCRADGTAPCNSPVTLANLMNETVLGLALDLQTTVSNLYVLSRQTQVPPGSNVQYTVRHFTVTN